MREHEELSEFHTLDVNERAATERALKRCLALADKIARELSKKKPEDFPSTLSLADFQASLERVAEVLEDHPPKNRAVHGAGKRPVHRPNVAMPEPTSRSGQGLPGASEATNLSSDVAFAQ
jgi:hypothetical protein